MMLGMIEGVDHVGLPSKREDWPRLAAYYRSLGLDVREAEIMDPAYDYIGVGPRLQVSCNGRLFASYFLGDHPPHIGFKMSPMHLDRARHHEARTGETHWGHGNTSVFHDPLAPMASDHKIELVTTDPAFHRDRVL